MGVESTACEQEEEEKDEEDALEANPGDEERASLLPQKAPAVNGFDGGVGGAKLEVWHSKAPWSAVVLAGLIFILYLVIWSLPAPSFYAKVSLVRQSWHLSDVIQEPEKLRKELTSKEKEVRSLRAKVAEVQSTN